MEPSHVEYRGRFEWGRGCAHVLRRTVGVQDGAVFFGISPPNGRGADLRAMKGVSFRSPGTGGKIALIKDGRF